jgi:ComF family protein
MSEVSQSDPPPQRTAASGPPRIAAWRAVVRVLRSTATVPLDNLTAVLFPADCRVCNTPLPGFSLLPICSSCWNDLPSQSGALCALCGESLEGNPAAPPDGLCRLCRTSPPPFERAVAHGVYQGTLRNLLHLLKYDGMQPIARRLGLLLADQLLATPGLPSNLVVVPVPLFGAKQRRRGFNQSELLAQGCLAAIRRRRPELCLALASGALQRQRATDSQAGLSPHQRRVNLRGAFFAPQPAWVAGRNILLIDDIYTTGATARGCSQALRRAGAASVWVATVARAQWEFPASLSGFAVPATRDTAETYESDTPSEMPMDEDIAFWEEGRTVLTGGGTS